MCLCLVYACGGYNYYYTKCPKDMYGIKQGADVLVLAANRKEAEIKANKGYVYDCDKLSEYDILRGVELFGEIFIAYQKAMKLKEDSGFLRRS